MTTRDSLRSFRPRQRKAEPRRRYVVEISVDRCYGGPEEGGWWYDWTTVENVWWFTNPRVARRHRKRVQREQDRYRPRHNRFSVLGGTDHEVVRANSRQEVEDLQTRRRPRYE